MTTAIIRPSFGLRPPTQAGKPQISGWTAQQLQVALELVTITRQARNSGYQGRVADLAMLAVAIQEDSLGAGGVGDNGQSFGPLQIYQVAHPNTWQLAISPDANFAYFTVCFTPWEVAWQAVGGAPAWANAANRGAFVQAFAPRAQGSISWPAGLGAIRYAEAVSVLEIIS